MDVKRIITQRRSNCNAYMDIVYEWEDVFVELMSLKISYDDGKRNLPFIKKIPYLSNFFTTWSNSIKFDLYTGDTRGMNKQNIYPIIVDFYSNISTLDEFYKCYRRHKVVFVSSLEAFLFLKKQKKTPFLLKHLPLSIPDKYKLTHNSNFKKKYDLVLFGRQNEVLMSFLKIYKNKYPDFVYVERIQDNGHFKYYTTDGCFIGNIDTREEYIDLMKKTRIGFWSTPGIDGGEQRTNGFNQVTPRFLEYIACGCHIISRYPTNADTIYYDVSSITQSVETYEEFEATMNYYRHAQVDYAKYSQYLSNHYTSNRVKSLINILNNL